MIVLSISDNAGADLRVGLKELALPTPTLCYYFTFRYHLSSLP